MQETTMCTMGYTCQSGDGQGRGDLRSRAERPALKHGQPGHLMLAIGAPLADF